MGCAGGGVVVDPQGLTAERILQERGISASEGTLNKAYDHAHPEIVQSAVESGEMLRRGKHTRIDPKSRKRMRAMLLASEKPAKIAEVVGCSVNTVYRERRRLIESDATKRAA